MFYVDEVKCVGCGKCIKTCQQGAIRLTNQKANINNKLCNECGMCYQTCPNGAVVEVQTKTNNTGLATAVAGMFQSIYDRVSTQRGQYNQCGYRRLRGSGQKRRGCGRGKGRF